MHSRMCVLGTSVLALGLAAGRTHADTRSIDDVEAPDKATPMSAWTPVQQYMPVAGRGRAETWGYHNPAGMLVMADELGDKLSELGRFSVIDVCFQYAQEDTSSTLIWALCGPDVKALDLKKLEAELDAENINPSSKKDVLDRVNRNYGKAKKIGEIVDAAAKDDPGVQQVIKLADQAKAEWTTYLAKNKDAFARYLSLKDGVRSGKSNHKSFQGCWEATQPPFVKLVKATKFPWDMEGDALPGYVNMMLTSTENYITVASFAACAYSVHESGEALAAATLSAQHGGVIRVGWRSIAVAKALDPNFKPKFAERSLNYGEYGMQSPFIRSTINMASINGTSAIMTPQQGVIAKVKKDGDITHLSFKGDTVDACLEWKTTNRVQSVSPNGDVNYQKVCAKRGQVANQESDAEVATKFAAGLAPGVQVLIIYKMPVNAWKGKKWVAVFGVPI